MTDDKSAIESLAQVYFDALYDGDADRLESIFHPESSLAHEDGGRVVVISRDDWLEVVRKRTSPKSKNSPRGDEILLIDQSSPINALLKVKCQVPPRYYTDYLCLIKTGDVWRVAQKVFATEVRK